MKNLNLKGLCGNSQLPVNPVGQPTVERRSRMTSICLCLLVLLTLGVGNVWGWNSISSGKRLYYFNTESGWNSGVWIHIWKNDQTWDYSLTRVGSTNYWYYDSGNGWSEISGFQFYKVNDLAGSKTKEIYGNVTNSTVFVRDNNWNNNVHWISSYYYVTPSGGATIYFDNTNFDYDASKIYLRAGFSDCNEAFPMSKVSGTANLYKVTLPNAYPYEAIAIANNAGYTNLNSIYGLGGGDYAVTKSTVHKKANITGDITYLYYSTGNTSDGCTYYNYTELNGHTRNVAITAPTGGTIQVSYRDENNSAQSFTSGNRNLAQTCNITVTATADRGYTFTSLTRNSAAFTSGSTYAIRENNTFAATFTPKSYTTVNLNNQGGTGSATIGSTVTTGTAYPSVAKPVKNGYHFMGYYSGTNGTGTKYYNEDGTPAAGAWFVDANTDVATPTLYAYYATPTISATFSPASVLPLETVTVNPSFNYDPEGNSTLCYVLTTSTGAEMAVQPTFSPTGEGNAVSFEAPATPGTYSVDIRLFNANEHSCADRETGLVSTYSHLNSFTVEASNAVTVQYKCGNVELRPSTTIYATSTQTSGAVTAPEIGGLVFTRWTTGANVSLADGSTATDRTVSVNASAAGTLTAEYSQGPLFFKNTKGWDKVYVYFYKSNKYFYTSSGNSEGTGSSSTWKSGEECPFISGPYEMTLLEGTDEVYYYDGNIPANATVFAFTDTKMTSYNYFAGSTTTPCEVVRVTSVNANKPMIVPVGNGALWNQSKAKYYGHDEAPILMDWGYALRSNIDDWSTTKHKFTSAKLGDLSFTTTVYFDQGNYEYQWKVYQGDEGYGIEAKTVLTPSNLTTPNLEDRDALGYNVYLQSNTPGEYTFTLNYGLGTGTANTNGASVEHALTSNMKVTVTYPVVVGDFRLFNTDEKHPGNVVKKRANGKDVVDMFVAAGQSGSLKVQSCTAVSASSVTWGAPATATYATGVNFASILSTGGAGVYSFTIEQDENGANPKITKVEKYTGRFYVRTNCVNDDKWNYKDSKDAHAMTYSEYSTTLTKKPFSHYYVKDIHGTSGSTVNIRFTVATENSEAITDTIFAGDASGDYQDFFHNENLNRTANVRFTYNQATNKIWRAYTEGPTNDNYMRLKSNGADVFVVNNDGTKGSANGNIKFNDRNNWVYELDVYANVGAYVKLTAEMHNQSNTANTQYLKGISGNGSDGTQWSADDAELLLGGTGTAQRMRITYDFKTDRMITAWLPSGTIADGSTMDIDADVLLIRKHQLAGQSITIEGSGKLKSINTVYGVMQFEKDSLNDVTKSRYSRNMYWISFPFDVKLSDVFGVGTYGQHWIIEYYDGKERAQKGYWIDSPGFWKFVTPDMRDTFVLEANKGYVLALDLDKFGDGNNGSTLSPVWGNNVTTTYLYFPSSKPIGDLVNVSSVTVDLNQDGYRCTIDRTGNNGADINKNRTVADSYWHMIGAPSYASAGWTSGLGNAMPENNITDDLLYVYEWSPTTNLYTVHSTSSMTFNAMHSYMVQYNGDNITWTSVTAHPSEIVARRKQKAEDVRFAEFSLDLSRNGESQDNTYIRLTDDEEVQAGFDFNKDLAKEFNGNHANIYTIIDGYMPAAGNCLPLSATETTLVPVGVRISEAGEYTFSMPDGTSGVGVTLIDEETGVRTSLNALGYTVELSAGEYVKRFLLEISPIKNTPTDIENEEIVNRKSSNRKLLIDGILYIVRDGKMYDVHGARVK